MIYVFDSTSLIDLFRHYYPNRFPSLWERFDRIVEAEGAVSVREALNEVIQRKDRLSDWARSHRGFFPAPPSEELIVVAQILAVPHFQFLVSRQAQLQGKPVADPFVIARARVQGGCVVTEEVYRLHASRIPNVCEHFGVDCVDLEGFMEREGWTF